MNGSAVLTPYLNFMGQTKEAMEFYHSILGGELLMQTFGESGMPTSDEDKDKVIHADLKNGTLSFMASDGNSEHPVKMGDNIHMSIAGTDEEALRKYFDGLSKGGTIDMPLAKQFWGDTYGQLTDKFGVHWMINIAQATPQQ
jgi:PhnB protein